LNEGQVIQVIGPVVDIEFTSDVLPDLYNAITITTDRINITMEAMQHLGNNTVRCVALSSTDGLQRGMKAVDTGAPISVPVGRATLGRLFNVLGEPIDNQGPVATGERLPIHRPAPAFADLQPSTEVLETGIKGRRPAGSLCPGR